MAKDGLSIREIVHRTGHSRGLVRKILRGQRSDVSDHVKARWNSTCPGSMPVGLLATAMVQRCGGSSRGKGSEAAFES